LATSGAIAPAVVRHDAVGLIGTLILISCIITSNAHGSHNGSQLLVLMLPMLACTGRL
jgi:hypothetical protein